jgi:hypothetical protein
MCLCKLFVILFFECWCAHAESPAPPAEAMKGAHGWTNGRNRARLGHSRAAMRQAVRALLVWIALKNRFRKKKCTFYWFDLRLKLNFRNFLFQNLGKIRQALTD